ncbi:MAG: GNAT family N-acetyltransferase, partial [Acidimicrobiales bacterium]
GHRAVIRDAVAADLPVIAELIRALADYERMADEVVWAEADLGRHLFGPEPAAHVLMAVADDGAVAGFALWFRSFSTFLGRPGVWLEDLFVRPEHRGAGHGRALLDALRQRTDGRVEWNVLDWNEPSIRFYDALGARPLPGWITYRWLPEG